MLESPGEDRNSWCLALWRGLDDDVVEFRPYLTGDVVDGVDFDMPGVGPMTAKVIVLTHPCSMRRDGVHLTDRLLVAVVVERDVLGGGWPTESFFKVMPLPDLTGPGSEWVADFAQMVFVTADSLKAGRRIACMELEGMNLLMQRQVHFLTRVAPSRDQFAQATTGVFEEIDLTEEWLEEAGSANADLDQAQVDCHEWLRGEEGESTRQELLASEQHRTRVRKACKSAAREKYRSD